jgi:L-amino acid N-acyltransferase YncA
MYTVKAFKNYAEVEPSLNKLIDRLYAGDPFYKYEKITMLDDYKPVFFVVYKDMVPASAACALLNMALAYKNAIPGLFGCFESINDFQSFSLLMNEIKKHFQNQGINYLIGPLNASTWLKYRITMPDNNPPFFMDNYHKPWYSSLFEQYGMDVIASYISTSYKRNKFSFSRLEKAKQILEQKGIHIRNITSDQIKYQLTDFYTVSIDSFSSNFLYSPVSYEIFLNLYKDIEKLEDKVTILLAEKSDHTPCGFALAVDNIYDNSQKGLIIKTVATINDSDCKGLGACMVEELHKKAYQKRYDEIIHALMHSNNLSMNILKSKGEAFRTYCLYGGTCE